MQNTHAAYSPCKPELALVLEQTIQDICSVISPLFYEPVMDDFYGLDIPGHPKLYVIDQALGKYAIPSMHVTINQ